MELTDLLDRSHGFHTPLVFNVSVRANGDVVGISVIKLFLWKLEQNFDTCIRFDQIPDYDM